MPPTECDIRELCPELMGDYLAYFDHDAFADNPKWASCYCHCYYFPHQLKPWKDQTGEQNRAAVCELIGARKMQGHLAYLDGKVVGWCNAAPRPMLTALQDEPEPQAERIGTIVCFNVAKPYRGQGIARRLLEAACEGFRRQGLALAEGFPRHDTFDPAPNYKGPLSMYLDAGFEVVRKQDNGITHVRKAL
jgi:GNAT superfamily N-acetyltransferase